MPETVPHLLTGLTSKEAASRLAAEGYNELPVQERRSPLKIVTDVLREPMFLLLIASGGIYFLLGDWQEGAILLSFVIVIIGIEVYQQEKTEHALDALRNLSSPRALVIRDGRHIRIAGRDVVRGDFFIVHEGDRIPADAVLLTGQNLIVDESLLTGESVPVQKLPAATDLPESKQLGGDDQPWLYSGTLVVQGQGIAEVLRIGSFTEMGKIGKALQTLDREETRLNRETARLVRTVALVGLCLCATIVVVYGLTRGDWVHGLLAGITLAMAILPEEFPVVLTIFLAIGAWRLSKYNVLTRNIPAIETLGSATVLCVDKTGTLTQNRMAVAQLIVRGARYDFTSEWKENLPDQFHELLEFAILSSKQDPFDPMEQALLLIGKNDLDGTEHLHADWELAKEYPLSRELLAVSNVWKLRDGSAYTIASKGAPEAIADLCHMDEAQRADLEAEVEQLAAAGLRVLGVARAPYKRTDLPDKQHDFVFRFLGLIGFADPVRPGVSGAIRECYTAGIRVCVITGDYPSTAKNIGRQIGLKSAEKAITGPELDSMGDADLTRVVQTTTLFARVVPEQKLKIVNALKANGEIVAMTGDGVNDAPALKSAHIGIAMGMRGTDVAREASSLVLLDDAFESIVSAVRIGRRIFDNLRKTMAYIISIHIPIAGMSLVPVLLGWPLILLPIHIVFLELIIDPACSLVFEAEPEERDLMKRPPRLAEDRILNRRTITFALVQGFVVLAVVLAVYLYAIFAGLGENGTRTLAFTTIVIANLALILTNRSWSDPIFNTPFSTNRALCWVIGGTLFFLALAVLVPALQGIFLFAPLGFKNMCIGVIAGVGSVLWFEFYKIVRRTSEHHRGNTV